MVKLLLHLIVLWKLVNYSVNSIGSWLAENSSCMACICDWIFNCFGFGVLAIKWKPLCCTHLEESYCLRKWRALVVNIKSYQSGWLLLSSHDVTAVHLKTSIKMNIIHAFVLFLCCNYLGGIKANRTFQKKVRKWRTKSMVLRGCVLPLSSSSPCITIAL